VSRFTTENIQRPTQTTRNLNGVPTYQGTYYGIVMTTAGAREEGTYADGTTRLVGMPSAIFYSVAIQNDGPPWLLQDIQPSNRRPISNAEIEAAIPGDPCVLLISGQFYRVLIFEGLAATQC